MKPIEVNDEIEIQVGDNIAKGIVTAIQPKGYYRLGNYTELGDLEIKVRLTDVKTEVKSS